MLFKLAKRINDRITWPVTTLSIGVFLVFLFIVLPQQSLSSQGRSSGAGSPDMSFYYSNQDLYQMADAYGAAGRQEYVEARFTFDLVFPLAYLFFLVSTISMLSRAVFPNHDRMLVVNLFPVAGTVFDYLENISTSVVMLRYPLLTPVLDQIAGWFTAIKWAFVGGSMLILGVLIIAAIGKRIKN